MDTGIVRLNFLKYLVDHRDILAEEKKLGFARLPGRNKRSITSISVGYISFVGHILVHEETVQDFDRRNTM